MVDETEQEPTPRRRRWPRRLAWVAGVVLVCLIAARASLPSVAEAWLLNWARTAGGVELTVDDIDVNLLGGSARVHGLEARLGRDKLATCESADVRMDFYEVIFDGSGKIAVDLHGMEAFLFVSPDGALNLARIGPTDAVESVEVVEDLDVRAEPTGRPLVLDVSVEDARVHFTDMVTDPNETLHLEGHDVDFRMTEVQVSNRRGGPPFGDLRLSGGIAQEEGPAMFGFAAWGDGLDGADYAEIHGAVTAFDARRIPQYVTSSARSILGGPILNASVIGRTDRGLFVQGVIDVEVEGKRTSVELHFGGPLTEPVFDADSDLLDAFSFSFVRIGDQGEVALKTGRDLGVTLWERASGLGTDSATAITEAVGEASLRKLGTGLFGAVKGLVLGKGTDADTRAEIVARWTEYATRQLAFRELVAQRRIEVAHEREPERVAEFERLLAEQAWRERVQSRIPAADRK